MIVRNLIFLMLEISKMDSKHLISQLADIPKENQHSGNNLSTIIPDKYQDKLINIMDEMEAELGIPFFIMIRQQNKNQKEIYPINERKRKYTITMKDKKHEHLNGVYFSISSIEDKISSLNVNDVLSQRNSLTIEKVNDRYVWKCIGCNCYGIKFTDSNMLIRINYYNYRNSWRHFCVNCSYNPNFPSSIWNIDLYPEIGIVGSAKSDSLHQIVELGELTITQD